MRNRELTVDRRSSLWRRFSWLLSLAAISLNLLAQTPPTTTVSDTVFRADGTPAAGTLLISWPAFTTANGDAIASGTISTMLGGGGALSVGLVPNAGGTPSNTVYTVVYQLSDGTVKTEFWIVPATSPTNLATVRTVLGSGGSATSVATKSYVDTAVASAGGSFVNKSGDSMNGPLQVNAGLTLAGAVHTTGAWTIDGAFASMTAAAANKSKLGFGASGKLQVSENGATVVDVAKLDTSGNVSANANTATRLAQTPTQCNGSFATGVQTNGNANCSTPDIVQLAETTAPSGIANFGIFWFDSACHCPKVISNNGQAVQLGLLNIFNLDANTLEQYNGTNVQSFNLYGTRTDASNYERLGLTYDATNQYYVADVEKAGAGTQRGFGIKLQGSIRWVWDTAFNFKPFSDNNRDIGASALRVRDFYLGRNLIMSSVASTYNGRATAGPGLVAVYGAPVSSTGNTAAVSSTTLCSATACPAGQYTVDYYADSTVSCATPGPAAASITLGWTDEISAKTLQVGLSGAGISGGNSMALGNTANFGSGSFTLWSAGTAAITYSSSYTACTSGTGTYALRLAVRQVQ